MDSHTNAITICPLLYFQISKSKIFTEKGNPLEQLQQVKDLEHEFCQGYQISEYVVLRRIKGGELDCYLSSNLSEVKGQIANLVTQQTFVLEIKKHPTKNAARLAYEVLLALRLMKGGDVFCKVLWGQRNQQISSLTVIDPPVPFLPSNYSLNSEEIGGLTSLLAEIDKTDLDKNKTLRIACERFSRSYEQRREDDIIVDFSIAFEALFFEGSKAPSSSSGQFIGIGCSMLLGATKQERREINAFFVRTFDIRNKIVHGSGIVEPIKIDGRTYSLEEFTEKLKDYLRNSILKLMT
jgi:hypothetical protein